MWNKSSTQEFLKVKYHLFLITAYEGQAFLDIMDEVVLYFEVRIYYGVMNGWDIAKKRLRFCKIFIKDVLACPLAALSIS